MRIDQWPTPAIVDNSRMPQSRRHQNTVVDSLLQYSHLPYLKSLPTTQIATMLSYDSRTWSGVMLGIVQVPVFGSGTSFLSKLPYPARVIWSEEDLGLPVHALPKKGLLLDFRRELDATFWKVTHGLFVNLFNEKKRRRNQRLFVVMSNWTMSEVGMRWRRQSKLCNFKLLDRYKNETLRIFLRSFIFELRCRCYNEGRGRHILLTLRLYSIRKDLVDALLCYLIQEAVPASENV